MKQMKHRAFCMTGLLAAALVFGSIFIGCEKDDATSGSNANRDQLIGTWVGSLAVGFDEPELHATLTFSSSTWTFYAGSEISKTGTYQYIANVVTTQLFSGGFLFGTAEFRGGDGNTLRVYLEDGAGSYSGSEGYFRK
jgi:hypothetical protein